MTVIKSIVFLWLSAGFIGCTSTVSRLQKTIVLEHTTAKDRTDAFRRLMQMPVTESAESWARVVRNRDCNPIARGLALQALFSRHAKTPMPFSVLMRRLGIATFLNESTLVDANREEQTPFGEPPEGQMPGIDVIRIEDRMVPDRWLFPVFIKLSKSVPVDRLLAMLTTKSGKGTEVSVIAVAPMSTDEAIEQALHMKLGEPVE
jgi:hypothetical protein